MRIIPLSVDGVYEIRFMRGLFMKLFTNFHTRAAFVFFLISIVFGLEALLSAQKQVVAGDADSAIYLLDISSLQSAAIDQACALPEVEGWVEIGGTLLLLGTETLEAELSRAVPDITYTVVSGSREQLWLARSSSRTAIESLGQGTRVLFGFGRYAVILAAPDVVRPFLNRSDSEVVLGSLPWNTALIRRSDRIYPPTAKATRSPIISAAVEAFDLEKYTRVVTDLVDFGTRYTYASSFPNVTDYLRAELEALGYAVTMDPFPISGYTRRNVIAEIAGDVTPDDIYIVCGHCDSTSQNPYSSAPGADDNASGAGAVIEIARALKQYRFDSTIRFICFSGEEQGLVGSFAYVDDLIASGQLGNVKSVFNMDMIGYLNSSVWDVLLEGDATVSQQNLSLLASLVPQYTTLTSYISTNPYGSDHMPFIYEDVNAVLTIEYEDWYNPNYHTTNDKMNTLTMPFAGEIVKLNIAATATQAGIKGGYMLKYGSGLAGSGGFIPHSSGTGSCNLGDAFTVDLNQGLGGALCLFAFGSSSASLPFFGGTFLIDPVGAIFTMLQLDGSIGAPGEGDLPINVTMPMEPSMSGVSLFIQFIVKDIGAVKGLSLSNGLELVIGI